MDDSTDGIPIETKELKAHDPDLLEYDWRFYEYMGTEIGKALEIRGGKPWPVALKRMCDIKPGDEVFIPNILGGWDIGTVRVGENGWYAETEFYYSDLEFAHDDRMSWCSIGQQSKAGLLPIVFA